jgi:molybdenum cofactor guanylyltransferase
MPSVMVQLAQHNLTVVILAGGKATRFPGKLEVPIEGTPLLVHVYRQFRDCARVVIAGAGTFSSRLDAQLDCPIVVDRWPGRGPLGGLLSACGELTTRRVFALAGDAPRVTPRVLEMLLDAFTDGDEAVVPAHDGRHEPLAALYDREAMLREGFDVLHHGNASMHALLAKLRTRSVAFDSEFFTNINTVADLV